MANEAYVKTGTWYLVSGENSASYTLSMEGCANAAGRVSRQIDWGASPRPGMYQWTARCLWQGTSTQYGTLDLYVAAAEESAAAQIAGNLLQTESTLSDVDKRYNLMYIGSVVAEEATASVTFIAQGTFSFPFRYMTIVGYNAGGSTIGADKSNFRMYIAPYSWQGQ